MAMQAEREAMQAEWKKERRDMEKLSGELQTQVAIGDCGVLVHACHIWWRHIAGLLLEGATINTGPGTRGPGTQGPEDPSTGTRGPEYRDPRTQILEGCVGL